MKSKRATAAKKTPISLSDAQDILRSYNLRVTPARIALIDCLGSESEPVSLQYLEKKLAPHADPVTIYRSIESMIEAGVVAQVDFQHKHTHYELMVDRAHHHHIVCDGCGTVEDVEICGERKLENSILAASKRFAMIDRHSLEFFGTCSSCLKVKK